MTEWTTSSLAEIAELRFGKTPSRSEALFWNPSGGYPWATIADMRTDPVLETAETVSEAGLPFAGRSVSAGSIMMSFKLTVGRVARAGTELLTNEAIVSVHGLEGKANDGWLYHALPGIARGGVTDTAVKGSTLNKSKLEKLKVHLPPLEEQRRIAEILDTIDETIQATQRVIVKYKRVRAGLTDVLLSGDSDAADPENWKSERSWADVLRQDQPQAGIRNRVDVRLLDLADSMVDGPFGSALKTEHYVRDAGVRVVRLANLSEGSYLNEDEAFIKEDYARLLSRHDVRSGDVLVASLGDDNHRPGRACLYPVEFAPGIVKADCFRVRPSESVDPRFLMEMLNSRSVASQLRRLSQGVTRDRVNLRQLRWIVLRVPPLDEQRLIAKILDTVDEAVQADEEQLNKLRELRSGLSSDLLSGRVRTVAA